MNNAVPFCGGSDDRNRKYEENYTPEKFYRPIIPSESPLILDVGAHHGESVEFFKAIFPNSTIYSFEPDPDNYKLLKDFCDNINLNNTQSGLIHPVNMGIAEKEGTMSFYKQSISHLGSFLPVNRHSKDSLGYASSANNNVIEVSVTSLDAFCSQSNVRNVDLLKIDVQGYEVAVLKGAMQTLPKVRCCTIEVNFFDFYQNSSSLLEVETIMNKSCHRLCDIAKVSKNPKNLRTDWVELVYINQLLCEL